MTDRRILVDAYFDGETLFDRGPFLISVDGGVIGRIVGAAPGAIADAAGA